MAKTACVAKPHTLPMQATLAKSGTATWTAGSGHVKVTNNATESSQSQATRAQPKRPTPRESEIHVGKTLPPNAYAQVSYLNGKEVPYGTKGSLKTAKPRFRLPILCPYPPRAVQSPPYSLVLGAQKCPT